MALPLPAILMLLLAQELEAALEIALLLAQALFEALEVLALLPGLLLGLGFGGGAPLLDLQVHFLEADAGAAFGVLLCGLGALASARQGGLRRAPDEQRHHGQARDEEDGYQNRQHVGLQGRKSGSDDGRGRGTEPGARPRGAATGGVREPPLGRVEETI